MAPRPFRIEVPEEEVGRLKARLAETRFPDRLTDERPWQDGTDLEYLEGLLAYWRSGYDWRAWEARLNALPQFVEAVQGVDVHFVHVRSGRPGAVPLLLVHGWPGSFFEFYKVIPLLMEKGDYDIVAPSLPGFGFSSAPTKKGWGVTRIASVFDDLMGALGYGRYIVQGGDWGAIIGRVMSRNHAPRCAGLHTNMCVTAPSFISPWQILQMVNAALAAYLPVPPLVLTAGELAGIKDMVRFRAKESGYQAIQSTKPQTLGYALTDSPAGLAAWIVEKFKAWTDCKGSPEDAVTRDEMLTNVSIYWFGGRITSSLRIYKEVLGSSSERGAILGRWCATPAAVALFPREISRPPRAWASNYYNVQQWTEMAKGGHFAALEQPELLAADLDGFVRLARSKGWV